MISSMGAVASRLRMVKDGSTLPPSGYTKPGGRRGGEDVIDPGRVYDRYSEGATIVLESLHRYWQPLTDFCRDLELALGHRLQVNAYITPPGAQGFEVHRDDHDVFVLQVSGSKHWKVYDRTDDEHVLIDESLQAGRCLYIPEGFPHAAETGAEASAHLTVGILTYDGTDILRELVKLAEEESFFRERLPIGLSTAPGALRQEVERQLEGLRAWLDKVEGAELTELVARRVAATSQPILRGQLKQLEALDRIGPGTQLERRRGTICLLFADETHVRMLLADRELQMPLFVKPALERVVESEGLQVRELHSFLHPDGALVLARRLVREGLLEVGLAG